MRIVHLSTSDTAGGASRAAYRVHTGLKGLGHDSRMFVQKKWSVDPTVTGFTPSGGLVDRLRVRVRQRRITADFAPYPGKRPPGAEPFADDRTPYGDQPLRGLPECDIINLHWVAGFVDHLPFFETFKRRFPKVPLVWRLADMAPATGGCHYDRGCGRFKAQCGACPELGSNIDADLSRQIWQRKHDALANVGDAGMHIVATSRWVAEVASQSSLLGRFKRTIIPNALDTSVYQPRDKGFSRDLLGIPRNAKVVLFAADSSKHPRKGFAQLTEALEGIRGVDNLTLASVGGGKPAIGGNIPLINVGKVDDDRVLSMAYSAADVYVIPSLQEAFGQTVIESMACGTPIVGFASGGITDTVRPGQTGLLAPTGDVGALRQAIVDLLQDDAARHRLAETCRATALAEYALPVQARQYEALYRSLLGNS
ncbi:glycosyltransferase family 4 protein [Humisphaera borealis]|uniref:Glycosyltransferase family 4 protein n=1 Tax=Humisphaera borealis TaxID=2807512 RepID=A0A7M2WR68_9BACT|nr:glycosyltransferase family 4 protein [Humisphaera borealis]QOV87966.1 glycosyltransferase family 4 protein [Humisphaera borealis]